MIMLIVVAAVLCLLLAAQTFFYHRDMADWREAMISTQIRFLEQVSERNETVMRITEALLQSEGHQIKLTKQEPIKVETPGWLKKKTFDETVPNPGTDK